MGRRAVMVLWVVACSDDWKEPVKEHDVLVCRYEAVCADSTAGLDCAAYEQQYVARPNPCLNYDDYYIDACLTQLREVVEAVEDDATVCGDRDEDAPACTQAFTALHGGRCL